MSIPCMSIHFSQNPEYDQHQLRCYSNNYKLSKDELVERLKSEILTLAEDANKLDVKDKIQGDIFLQFVESIKYLTELIKYVDQKYLVICKG